MQQSGKTGIILSTDEKFATFSVITFSNYIPNRYANHCASAAGENVVGPHHVIHMNMFKTFERSS
jgi:hypothetical protein